jgi:HK97 family phage prohead protease
MDILGQIRGYASVFDQYSCPLDGAEPLREKIHVGAFRLLHHPITANVAHCSAPVGTTWDRSLRLWQDSHGLAFELDVEATPVGAGLRDLVARGMNGMSFGLLEPRAEYYRDENGLLHRTVLKCDVDHVAICDSGAYRSACCWLSDMPADRMSREIRAASISWHFGRIARDRKQGADRALARYLAAQAAAPADYRKPKILLHGMEPAEYMRLHGLHF